MTETLTPSPTYRYREHRGEMTRLHQFLQSSVKGQRSAQSEFDLFSLSYWMNCLNYFTHQIHHSMPDLLKYTAASNTQTSVYFLIWNSFSILTRGNQYPLDSTYGIKNGITIGSCTQITLVHYR